MIKKFIAGVLLSSAMLFGGNAVAAINGTTVVMDGPPTTCNNGVTEREVAGTMTTTCGDGWSVGPLGSPDGTPSLAFCDLKSGPDTGLGDGLGSGALVTCWGHNLGSEQGSGKAYYVDSLSTQREAHVYYWKNADGTLPGGPSNLYKSHKMQEIAFSIPDSALGTGRIKITVSGVEAVTASGGDMSFTVTDPALSSIYHVAVGGSNSNPCTFASPCAYIDGGLNPTSSLALGNERLSAGDIVYSHGVAETGTRPESCGGGRCVGLFLRGIVGTQDNPVSLVAYPNPTAFSTITSANQGVDPYLSQGINIFKYHIKVGYADPLDPPNAGATFASNWHISASKYGRSVGNLMTQIDGTCFTGWHGSFTGGGDNHKIYGNHIKELGCDNSSRFSHTLYMGLRNTAANVPQPWEISWNYLESNNVFYGIHNYDEANAENPDCGILTGTLKIKNNVVTNQRGAGINVGTRDTVGTQNVCWQPDFEITGNILYNVGLGVPQEDGVVSSQALNVGGDLGGSSLIIKNNIIYGHGEPSSLGVNLDHMVQLSYDFSNPTIDISDNVFVQTSNLPWFSSTETYSGSKNLFWSTATSSGNSPPPLTDNIIADPLLIITDPIFEIGSGSPVLNAGGTTTCNTDLYGNDCGTNVGAIQ